MPLTTIWPMTDEARTRRHRPAPSEPLLRARPSGAVRFVCPTCGSLEQVAKVQWRTGRKACDQCRRWVSFGVAFWDAAEATCAPWNCLFMGTLGTPTNNRVRPDGGQAWVGEIRGPLIWACPCGAKARCSFIKANAVLLCDRCRSRWAVGLLVYVPPRGHRLGVPTDWVIPGGWDEDSHEARKAASRRAYRRRIGATGRTVASRVRDAPVAGRVRAARGPADGEGLLRGDDGV